MQEGSEEKDVLILGRGRAQTKLETTGRTRVGSEILECVQEMWALGRRWQSAYWAFVT